MLKRWAAWPPGIRWLAGIAAVVLAAAIVWVLFVLLADWLARHDVGSAKPALLQTARDAARGRLLTLLAGLFAAGALVFTALNFNLSREGQVTDRYTKAIEQLGSDKLDVRIGGIYALERVARDSAKDHPTVMEVLTAFIREHSREPWSLSDPDIPEQLQERLTRPDVQAAVTVVGRRDAKHDILPIDLTRATVISATFPRTNLAGANLHRAFLIDADLTDADLTGADLTHASLAGADLTRADLTGANFHRGHLTDANLTDANLTDANLTDANLTRADLTRADLTDTVHADTFLTNTGDTRYLAGPNLTRADLTGVKWPAAEPVPEGWMKDGDSDRLKRADGLSEVTAHYP